MNYQLEELSIELSAACNCRCIMCSSGSTPKPLPNELTPDEILDLIHQARELGATVLSFSGGDPLLQYVQLARYIRSAIDMGYESVLVYTTGVGRSQATSPILAADTMYAYPHKQLGALLNSMEGYPRQVKKKLKDVVVFVFSLHSHKSHVHDYIMGLSGSWSVTVQAIRKVKTFGYKAWVHCVPMRPNWLHIPRLFEMCTGLVDKINFLRYVPQTRGKANRHLLSLDVDEFDEMQHMLHNLVVASENDPDLPNVRLGCPIDFRHATGILDEKAKPCHAGTDLMLVRPQGDVHPCAAWKTLPDDANVRNNTLREIWETSHVFQAIRKFREDGWMDLGGPCSMCQFLGSCKGGCPAQKLHWLGIYGMGQSNIADMYWPVSDPLCPLSGIGDDLE